MIFLTSNLHCWNSCSICLTNSLKYLAAKFLKQRYSLILHWIFPHFDCLRHRCFYCRFCHYSMSRGCPIGARSLVKLEVPGVHCGIYPKMNLSTSSPPLPPPLRRLDRQLLLHLVFHRNMCAFNQGFRLLYMFVTIHHCWWQQSKHKNPKSESLIQGHRSLRQKNRVVLGLILNKKFVDMIYKSGKSLLLDLIFGVLRWAGGRPRPRRSVIHYR